MSPIRQPVSKSFSHLDRISAPLIEHEVPDAAAARRRDEANLPFTWRNGKALDHPFRSRKHEPFRLGHAPALTLLIAESERATT
jgi:hypothetical protein